MENPTLYKKDSINNIKNRVTTPLSSEEAEEVSNTINKFFELFKNKHL